MYGMDAKHAEVSHFHPHLIVQLWQGQHEMFSFNSPIINLESGSYRKVYLQTI